MTTQFPVFRMELFANSQAGEGAIQIFKFRPFPVGCPETVPSLRIVDGAGVERDRIESTGRGVAVRQGNPGVAGDTQLLGENPLHQPSLPP